MRTEEIEATFLYECHRWDDTIIATAKNGAAGIFKLKTSAEPNELTPGLPYRWYGMWITHPRHGKQFQAKSFVAVQPHNESGIITYLKRGPGIGQVIAKELWLAYGSDAVRKLREDPEDVAKHVGKRFGKKTAQRAAEYFTSEKALEDATIDLLSLLSGRGFPHKTVKRALQKFGNKAADIIRQNPYRLMTFAGCGFGRTDEMYLDLGKSPGALKRQTLCIWHAMSRDLSGSTWFSREFIEKALSEKIASAIAQPAKAVMLGVRAGLFSVRRENGTVWITEKKRADEEQTIADRVGYMMHTKHEWPVVADLPDVSDHQREKLSAALNARVGIFAGCAGTGKSYSCARLVQQLIDSHGETDVAVIAPTGRAAVRITELMQEYGVNVKARTIHSFLGVRGVDEGRSSVFSFAHNADDPVEHRWIICDEASMLSCSVFSSLLAALRDDAHLLLIGDLAQLPPVGHGAPLRDMMSAGVPIGELTEIRRNAGKIVNVAHAVRSNKPVKLPRKFDFKHGGNLMIVPATNAAEAQTRALETIDSIKRNSKFHPVWDVQVVVARNDVRHEVNRTLQATLNEINRNGGRLWIGDKAIVLRNAMLPASKNDGATFDGQAYVANGEIGKVLGDDKMKTILELQAPKRIVLAPKGDEGKALIDLAYAVTTHKMQGSSSPITIVLVDGHGAARLICDRSWTYTAITRAEKACVLIGEESDFKAACNRNKISKRKTFMVELLKENKQ